MIWLGEGIAGDDTHGHVDDLCRFVSAKTIVLCREKDPKDANYRALEENRERLQDARLADGSRLEVVDLPMPAPLVFDGQRLPASYANFYIANAAVLVPTFNDPNDRVALGILAELFPDRPGGRHPRRRPRLGPRHAPLPDAAAAEGLDRRPRATGGARTVDSRARRRILRLRTTRPKEAIMGHTISRRGFMTAAAGAAVATRATGVAPAPDGARGRRGEARPPGRPAGPQRALPLLARHRRARGQGPPRGRCTAGSGTAATARR